MAAENVFSDLSRMIEQIGKDKGIDKDLVIEAVKQGMLVAARKKYGTYREIEAQYNEETGEVELYEFKEVVKDEDFIDEEVEIKMTEALELDSEAQVNDFIGVKLDTRELGRVAAQTAKQIIGQRVRDAERDIIFNEFEQRKGDIASGIARRVERGSIVVDLGRTEAYIPKRDQIPGEQYKPGDRIQGYIADVKQTNRGPQIIMSRSDNRYLEKLFELEVPEIYDGIVEIMSSAREPGHRAKIAVTSKEAAVDPVGACVGMKGSRVQNIIQELQGERIDIVIWDEEPARFASNALRPAEISKIFIDEVNHEMEIVVPDNQLSLAIGKRGQNVRLAARLTGWKLDITSESNAAAKTAEAIFNIMLIPGMSETMAQNIYQSGFESFQLIAESETESIQTIPGYEDEEKAAQLKADAVALLEKYAKEGVDVPVAPVQKSAVAKTGDAKSQAEERLKEELEALSSQEEAEAQTTEEVVAAGEDVDEKKDSDIEDGEGAVAAEPTTEEKA